MRFTVAFGLLAVCGFGSGAVVTETECPYLVLVEESKIIGSLMKANALKKAGRTGRAADGGEHKLEHLDHAKALANHPGMPATNKTQPRIVAFITTPARKSPVNLTAIENVQYICADGLPAKHVQLLRHCCSGTFNTKTKKCDSVCRAAPHKSRARRSASFTKADLHNGLKKVGSWFLYWFKIIFGFFFVMNNIQV